MSIIAVCHQGVNVYDDMPMSDYVADPAPEPSLNSSAAKALVTQSPLHAWTAHPRLNENYRPKESETFDIGSAAHALFLQGEDLMVECAFNDWRTNAAKDARDEARVAGKLPLLSKHVESIRKMAWIARKALADSELGVSIDDFYVERTVIWQDDGTWKRARFDMQHRTRAVILDYKTSESADPFSFPSLIVSYGYDIQAAHYSDAYHAMHPDVLAVDFIFLVQEHTPPYACSLVGVDPMLFDLGAQKVELATSIWRECMKSNRWPGYSKNIAWASAPAWALSQFEQRKQS